MRPPTDNKIGGANDQEKQVQKEIPNWFSFLLIGRLHSTIPLTPKIGGTPLLSLRAPRVNR
jgi:hypothetical protein